MSSRCSNCSVTTAGLQACARCKAVCYCSRDCQKEHWPAHKSDCAPSHNYILKFELIPSENEPPIWRTLSIPGATTFAKLHEALQIAFTWFDDHSFEFVVLDPAYDPDRDDPDLSQIIESRRKMDAMGPDFHKYRGDPSFVREYLLRIVDESQAARRKIDSLHAPTRAHPRTPTKKASCTKLYQILEKEEYKGKTLQYVYDLGDHWEHRISIVTTAPARASIACLDGRGGPILDSHEDYQPPENEVEEAERARAWDIVDIGRQLEAPA